MPPQETRVLAVPTERLVMGEGLERLLRTCTVCAARGRMSGAGSFATLGPLGNWYISGQRDM